MDKQFYFTKQYEVYFFDFRNNIVIFNFVSLVRIVLLNCNWSFFLKRVCHKMNSFISLDQEL